MFQALASCRSLVWPVARLACAAGLLWIVAADNPARLARLQYAALPDIDYLIEAQKLRSVGRYDESLAVLSAGIASVGVENPALCAALEAERESTAAQRDDPWRRLGQVGVGALVGTGHSLETFAGAIAADLFVVGDVRDLVIQSGRLAVDGEADSFILALSALGVVTTARPDLDWIPSFLKCVRKAGCVTKDMAGAVTRLCRHAIKDRNCAEFIRFSEHLRDIVKGSSLSGAARLLRHLDDPRDVEKVAGFIKRNPGGGFALHVTEKEGLRMILAGSRAADDVLLLAARKGKRGAAWLRSGNYRFLRPHPLIGIAKGFYKGNVQNGLSAFAARYLDPHGWFLVPALAAWLVFEIILFARRFGRLRPRPSRQTDTSSLTIAPAYGR